MHCSIWIIGHIGHFAFALPEHFNHDPNAVAIDIDMYFLKRFQFPAIFILDDNRFRPADLEFIPFAPHGFDQDAEVKFATPGDQEGVFLFSLSNT